MQVPDLERLMLGAIIIRANIHAADARIKAEISSLVCHVADSERRFMRQAMDLANR